MMNKNLLITLVTGILLFSTIGLAAPMYYSNVAFPANDTVFMNDKLYNFEIFWNQTDGNVSEITMGLLETNVTGTLTNYTMTNNTDGWYWSNFTQWDFKAAGYYTYKFYANDTSDVFNNTATVTYYSQKNTTSPFDFYADGTINATTPSIKESPGVNITMVQLYTNSGTSKLFRSTAATGPYTDITSYLGTYQTGLEVMTWYYITNITSNVNFSGNSTPQEIAVSVTAVATTGSGSGAGEPSVPTVPPGPVITQPEGFNLGTAFSNFFSGIGDALNGIWNWLTGWIGK